MKKYIPIILIAAMMSTPVLAVSYELAKSNMLKELRQGNIDKALNMAQELIKGPGARLKELGRDYLTVINSVKQSSPTRTISTEPMPTPMPQMVKTELTQKEWIDLGREKGWFELAPGAGVFPAKKTEEPWQKLLAKVDQAQISPKKLLIVKDGLNLAWSAAKPSEQEIIQNIEPFLLKVFEFASNKDIVREMINVYVNMTPEQRETIKNRILKELFATLAVTQAIKPPAGPPPLPPREPADKPAGPPPPLPPRESKEIGVQTTEVPPTPTAEIGVQTTAPEQTRIPTSPPMPSAPKVSAPAQTTTPIQKTPTTSTTAPEGLLKEITGGTTLRHVETPTPAPEGSALLEQIKEGIKLKPAPETAPATAPKSSLEQAIEQRREAIEPEETPEEEETWED